MSRAIASLYTSTRSGKCVSGSRTRCRLDHGVDHPWLRDPANGLSTRQIPFRSDTEISMQVGPSSDATVRRSGRDASSKHADKRFAQNRFVQSSLRWTRAGSRRSSTRGL
jgi:hypothetical protein